MAKKTANKTAKTGKRAGKRSPGVKPAAKKKVAAKRRGGAAGGGSTAPRKVSTGRGPGPAEIGRSLVEMFNAGKFQEVERAWWSPQICSCEGAGVQMEWRGRKAVEAKNAGWSQGHTMNGASAEGPFVGSTGFAVKFRIDVSEKATGKRTVMEEVGVYTVQNGKIVREEFMYGSTTPAPAAGS